MWDSHALFAQTSVPCPSAEVEWHSMHTNMKWSRKALFATWSQMYMKTSGDMMNKTSKCQLLSYLAGSYEGNDILKCRQKNPLLRTWREQRESTVISWISPKSVSPFNALAILYTFMLRIILKIKNGLYIIFFCFKINEEKLVQVYLLHY